jgi:hypothetical protein
MGQLIRGRRVLLKRRQTFVRWEYTPGLEVLEFRCCLD